MIRFKQIEPKKLNVMAMQGVLRDNVKAFTVQAVRDYYGVTSGWQGEQPVWTIEFWAKGWDINFTISTDEESKGGKKWVWADKGTPPHRIPKAGEAKLAFPSYFLAGSIPGSLSTVPSESGGETVFVTGHVMHPGTEARRWTEMLLEKEQPLFADWVESAFHKVAKESGHGG